MIDTNDINVTYTTGSGDVTSEVYVGSAANCSQAATTGWYFDNPTTPTQVILCGGACSIVQADPNATVNVVLGCPTNNLK
jgi:hypothetical protein